MALTPEEQAELDALEAEFSTSKASTPPEVEKRELDKNILTTLIETAGNLNPMSAATGMAKKAPGVKEFVDAPNENYSPDMGNIAVAGGTGAAIGAGVGAVTAGPAGAAVGAAGGGVLGLLGGAAEELVKSMGGTDFQALLAGMGTGGVASAGKSLIAGVGKTLAASDTAYLSRPLRAVLGITRSVDKMGMDSAEKAVRETVLGKVKPVDFMSTKNQDSVQEALSKTAQEAGVTIPAGEKVSSVYRKELYNTMDSLRNQGVPFQASNSFKGLLTELEEAKALKKVSANDIKIIKDLAASQLDKRPGVVAKSNDALLNLVQSGGKFNNKTGEAETLIGDDARKILAQKFDDYFTETGKPSFYQGLKNVERAEIIARTTDDLPMLFMGKLNPKELEEIAFNINKTPESKAAFRQGLGEYFSALPSGGTAAKTGDIMIKEFERLAPTLKQAKLLTPRELNTTQEMLRLIPKNISSERWKQIANNLINASVVAGASTLPKDVMRGE
jgi:hypothetical protein